MPKAKTHPTPKRKPLTFQEALDGAVMTEADFPPLLETREGWLTWAGDALPTLRTALYTLTRTVPQLAVGVAEETEAFKHVLGCFEQTEEELEKARLLVQAARERLEAAFAQSEVRQ